LLETLRDSRALAAIRERLDGGALLAGSSAGAMILAQKMVTDSWDSWTDALGVVSGIGVIPHHNTGVRTLNALTRAAADEKIAILGIDEATACVSNDSATWQVVGIGSVTVYAADQMQRYASGQHFRIRP
jgi:cyanophycinase